MLASMSDMRHIDLDVIIHRIIQTYCKLHNSHVCTSNVSEETEPYKSIATASK